MKTPEQQSNSTSPTSEQPQPTQNMSVQLAIGFQPIRFHLGGYEVTIAAKRVSSSLSDVISLLDWVCSRFGVDERSIKGKGKTQPLATARQFAYWVFHECCGMGFNEIARVMRKKCHGTITHGVQVINSRKDTDKHIKFLCSAMVEDLKAGRIKDASGNPVFWLREEV